MVRSNKNDKSNWFKMIIYSHNYFNSSTDILYNRYMHL